MSSAFLTKHPLLLLLSIAPAVLAAGLLAISFHPPVYKRIAKWRLPALIVVYIVTRFVLFYVVFIALGNREIGGDIRWFQRFGLGPLHGHVPYRDFVCLHSPLFPYIMAIPYGIWGHVSSGVLAFIAFDIACILLLCSLTRSMLGSDRVLDIAWLYTLNPMVWIVTVRYGQDESVVCCFLLLAVYLYLKDSKWLAPTSLALGVLCTKFTTAVGMLPIFSCSKSKVRDAFVAGGILVVTYAFFYTLVGKDILQPARHQALATEGVSITCIVDRLLISDNSHVILQRIACLLSVLVLCLVLYLAHRRKLHVLDILTVSLVAFLLLSPVSYKFYRLWYLGPLGIYALRSSGINRYSIYMTLLVLFDDFSFGLVSPPAKLYPMAVLAAGIVYFEAGYVIEILRGGPLACAETTNVPVQDKVPAGV